MCVVPQAYSYFAIDNCFLVRRQRRNAEEDRMIIYLQLVIRSRHGERHCREVVHESPCLL
jgi:hypothetical protein